ncbi:PREDICTED: uncharacterized protein LOC104510002 [Eurypyga helias]|uniref:uncharacterized protein LOC104510002 n=1 Tax=Eurypyga helias TaxID=54383 RepID=UPI0005291D08|nr:PREDICTED: uncharacterized protein LOC104510002 [Eurypyga helias]
MIYSSGRESYFNLNSTWYDPSGSWLDTRRTPFRYGYNTCSSGCDGEGVEGMRGHNYRHYGYRQPVCSERCHGYAAADSCHGGGDSSCVRRPTYSYGSSGGCHSYGRSVCSERCHGSSDSCHGGGSSCVRRPTYTYGSSGGCQSYGRSVCSETCHGSGYQGGKPRYSKPRQCIQQCCPTCPRPVQTCPPPVKTCPPPMQQCCVPVTKCIPRQQQKQVCKVPARKMK